MRYQERKQTLATAPSASETQTTEACTHQPIRPDLLGACIKDEAATGLAVRFARTSDFVLWQPQMLAGTGSWIPPTSLLAPVSLKMQVSFYQDYQSTPSKQRYYGEMIHKSASYVDRGVCVAAKTITRASNGNKYTRADGNIFRACDICIQKHRLCARLVTVLGEVKIAILPLPYIEREGRVWRDMAFWIRP